MPTRGGTLARARCPHRVGPHESFTRHSAPPAFGSVSQSVAGGDVQYAAATREGCSYRGPSPPACRDWDQLDPSVNSGPAYRFLACALSRPTETHERGTKILAASMRNRNYTLFHVVFLPAQVDFPAFQQKVATTRLIGRTEVVSQVCWVLGWVGTRIICGILFALSTS